MQIPNICRDCQLNLLPENGGRAGSPSLTLDLNLFPKFELIGRGAILPLCHKI